MLFGMAVVLILCLGLADLRRFKCLMVVAALLVVRDAKATSSADALGAYFGDAAEVWMTSGKVLVRTPCLSPSLGERPECGVTDAELRSFSRQERESWWSVRDRFRQTAGSVAKVVISEPPLFVEDGDRSRTGLLLMSIAFNESRFRGFVADGRCNDAGWRKSPEGLALTRMGTCDNGEARTVFSLHNFASLDVEDAARAALDKVRESFIRRGDLRNYTGEGKVMTRATPPKALERQELAERYARAHPFSP